MPDNIVLLEQEDPCAAANLIARTAMSLRDLATQLDEGTLLDPVEWVIPMSDIGTPNMAIHCDEIAARLGKKCLAVYAICLDEDVPLDRIYDIVDANRARNKALPVDQKRAFARVNNRRGCLGSRCLYLGKSEKTAERLAQHLTEADAATFALHLNYWPNDMAGNLIVRVIGVTGVASALLPFIEDQMAQDMPPIMGKRGSV